MNVTCPKCQSENQVNAPPPGVIRVVCARCATIFEATFNQGAAPSLGQPSMPPLAASASANPGRDTSGTPGRDTYATRIEPDFDEVLDIPLAGHADYQTDEPAPVFEDVFTTSGENLTPPVTVPAPPPDPRVTVPLSRHTPEPEFEPPSETQFSTQFDPQFDSRYNTQPEPQEAFVLPEPEPNGHMPPPLLTSWPVLSVDQEEFSAERHTSNSSRGAGRIFMRVALVVLVFGSLFFGVWYFLGDKIMQRDQPTNNIAANPPAPNNQNASGSGAASAPGSGAASETKPVAPNTSPAESKTAGASETKATDKPASQEATKKAETEAAKKDAAATAASALSKTAPPETTKPAPGNKNQSVVKPAPLDVPFGHAVKPGEGSVTVQVESFNNQAQANERVASLKSAGIEARAVKADIPGKGTWYRVQIGRFTTREEAIRYGNQLKARGLVKDAIPAGYQAR